MTKRSPLITRTPPGGPPEAGKLVPLKESTQRRLTHYFKELGDQEPNNLYRQVIEAVERPLIDAVLLRTRGNQSRAAEILGITRATLRKRLRRYGQL
ncbi:MAG: helix-turn-helix domain-containing protein [Thiohalospira sp.]